MLNLLCSHTMEALGHWFKKHGVKHAFDVGANVGGMTQAMLDLGAERVTAFEPLPPLCNGLVQIFAGDNRVSVVNMGLDAYHSHRRVGVFNCYTLAPKSWRELDPSPQFAGQEYDVEFVSIDEYCTVTESYPDFIKIDADGYESPIIDGALHTIEKMRPGIMVELSYIPTYLEIDIPLMVKRVYEMGYVFMSMDGSYTCPDWKTAMQHWPWHTSYDVMMVPKEKI